MAYDKKMLAAARRELERERAARADELEERKRAVYAREPRIRAIDRELSATAASVLRAALPPRQSNSCASATCLCRPSVRPCWDSWACPGIT